MSKNNETKAETFTVRQKFAYFSEHVTTVCHCLILWYVLYTWYIAFKTDGWDFSNLSLHATLYVTGWTLLMLEGIMVISPNNVISRLVSHDNRSRIHTILLIMSLGFSLGGFLILYVHRSRHFVSKHAKTGFGSLILMLLSCVNGLAALFSVQLKRFVSPGINKLIHSVCGIATFVLGTVSLYYGLDYGWYKRAVGEDTVKYTKAVLLFTLIWSMIQPLLTCFERIKYMF